MRRKAKRGNVQERRRRSERHCRSACYHELFLMPTRPLSKSERAELEELREEVRRLDRRVSAIEAVLRQIRPDIAPLRPRSVI